MIETYTMVEELIMTELKKHKFPTFRKKECIIMCSDIKLQHEITDKDFFEGIQSLIDKKLLLFKTSDSGIQFYQLSDKLKSILEID